MPALIAVLGNLDPYSVMVAEQMHYWIEKQLWRHALNFAANARLARKQRPRSSGYGMLSHT